MPALLPPEAEAKFARAVAAHLRGVGALTCSPG